MKNAMTNIGVAFAVAAILAATPVVSAAEDAADAAPLSASLDLPILSAYVWRGQVLNDEAVIQPSFTVSKGGFSLNYWESFNLTDAVTGDAYEFSEHDIALSYSALCPLTGANLTLGVVNYDFPNQSIPVGDVHEGHSSLVNDTREAYFVATFEKCPVTPSLYVYYDFKEADSFYLTLGFSHTFTLNDEVGLGMAFSSGWADKRYNEFYFDVNDSTFEDGNVTLSLPIKAGDSLLITPAVQYTWLWDSDLKDAADVQYKDKDQVVASLKAVYTF
ncbi:MAG: hypothetical protein V1929_08890 [bacterium]